jgi:transcription initiation factor TFIID TATA-box-binding protein
MDSGLQEPTIQVQNIVAFVDLQTQLDLDRLALTLPGSYRRERFPALIVKLKEPKMSFLIFSNGKMNCTGANQIAKIEEGVSKLVDRLRRLGIKIKKDPKIKVTNVVSTVDLGLTLQLDEIALNVDNVEYEPEQFPGLVYRPHDWPYDSSPSILVFGNGKLVVAGVREVSEARLLVGGLVESLREAGLLPSQR